MDSRANRRGHAAAVIMSLSRGAEPNDFVAGLMPRRKVSVHMPVTGPGGLV
jgi:hypothetical protein